MLPKGIAFLLLIILIGNFDFLSNLKCAKEICLPYLIFSILMHMDYRDCCHFSFWISFSFYVYDDQNVSTNEKYNIYSGIGQKVYVRYGHTVSIS